MRLGAVWLLCHLERSLMPIITLVTEIRAPIERSSGRAGAAEGWAKRGRQARGCFVCRLRGESEYNTDKSKEPNQEKITMMTVTLSAELEELVKAKVLSGQFNSSGEVIREGLRLLEEKDTLQQIKLDRLRKDLSIALEQVDRGEVAPLDIEAIIAEGHQRLAERAQK